MQPIPANSFAFLLIAIYLVAAVAVGYLVRGESETATKFLHARRSLPALITSLSFLAANCGALEIVGIVATSAKYGALALHFYWLGAIPAMVFLSLFMMPVYLCSGAMTVPDYVRRRYNNSTHILSAVCLASMMVLIAGISLYAISSVLHLFFGWNFSVVALVSASVVLCYALTGGLRATIYYEILQLVLTFAGLLPMVFAVYHDFNGVHGVIKELPTSMAHLWISLPLMQPKVAAMDVFGLVFGLAFVLSFGYWCTDFVLIQRALTARTLEGAIRTPLLAAVFKLLFPWFLIFPGMAAAFFLRQSQGRLQFDEALPMLIRHYYGYGLIGLGVSALLASLMSGLAGNISAFSALCTHDLYQVHIRPCQTDKHFLNVGRTFTALASVLSIATAYIVLSFNNLMDYLQLVFSLFNAPLFAIFALGMFTKWATPAGAFAGLLCGVAATSAHGVAVHNGAIEYGSPMLGNFYSAIYGFVVSAIVTGTVSLFSRAKTNDELRGLTYFTQVGPRMRIGAKTWALAGLVLSACLLLNYLFR